MLRFHCSTYGSLDVRVYPVAGQAANVALFIGSVGRVHQERGVRRKRGHGHGLRSKGISHCRPCVGKRSGKGSGRQIRILLIRLQTRISGGCVIRSSEEFIINVVQAEAGADGRLAIAKGIPGYADVWRELGKVLVVESAPAGATGKTESGVAEKRLVNC